MDTYKMSWIYSSTKIFVAVCAVMFLYLALCTYLVLPIIVDPMRTIILPRYITLTAILMIASWFLWIFLSVISVASLRSKAR